MKESNTLAGNAAIKQLKKDILINKKIWQYMKESNTRVDNASCKQLQRVILLDTKWQYLKESNTFTGYNYEATVKGNFA